MTKPVVFVTRRLPEAVEERLRRDWQARLNGSDRLLGGDEIVAGSRGADAILACPSERLTGEIVRRLDASVKIIATFSVGFEHIDVAAAGERGIVVTNTPDVLTDATADIAMLLILGAARRAPEGQAMLREGRWGVWTPTALRGVHVTGSRLGILGMGRIGQALARRARGFAMEVHYHNRRRLTADREGGARFHPSLDGLLAVSDILSIHCPSTPETAGLIDRRRIRQLPQGAIVVNTARGDIVCDEALIAALRSGRLSAAGLDVYAGEPDLHPGYLGLGNAFLLPHMGSATMATRDAMGFRALDNLDAFFAGREALDRVVGG